MAILSRKLMGDYAPRLVPPQRRCGSCRDGRSQAIPQPARSTQRRRFMADDDAQRFPCWPDDPDWLDGQTEIELSTRHLRAYWDADLIDVDDRNKHDTIIERKDPFEVRFRVELKGRLWYCICGHWCFDLGFTSIGKGEHFNLSDYLPEPEKSKLRICDWKGCDTRCIEVCVRVPPNTIPVDAAGRSTRWGPNSSCGAAATVTTSAAATSRWPGTSRRVSTCSTKRGRSGGRSAVGPG